MDLEAETQYIQAGGKPNTSSGRLINANGSYAILTVNKKSGNPKQSKSISNSTPRKVSPRTQNTRNN